MTESKKISLKLLDLNKGQIPGVPKNPWTWTREDVKNLAASMAETPELVEIRGLIVYPLNGRYVTVGGNKRLEAARLIKWPELPCFVLPEDTTAAKLMEIAAKDNGAYGELDMDAVKLEWGDVALKFGEWGIKMPESDRTRKAKDDHYDAEAKAASIRTPKSHMGDVYLLGRHRLMCGDSTKETDVKILMGGVLGDLAVTDPPYNVDYEGGTDAKLKIENDNMSNEAFRSFLLSAFRAMSSVLLAGAGAYVFYASREVVNFVEAFKASGFEYKQNLVWVKNSMVLGRQDYQWMHEPCLYGWKAGGPHYFTKDRTQTTVADDLPNFDAMSKAELQEFCNHAFREGGIEGDVIRENKPLRNAEHPTMKPIPLVGRFIQNSSRVGAAVLDPFGGSGTTLMACEQLDRRCFTMEYDPRYVDVIIDRWETYTGKKAVKL